MKTLPNQFGFLSYILVAIVGVLLVPDTLTSQESKEPAKNSAKIANMLQERLDQFVADDKFPGATLSVVMKDGTRIDLASGLEDADTKNELKVGARMLCGSTGKTIVSAVALQLVAEGKLDLEKLASEYFDSDEDRDWFSKLPNADTMTVRSLMNHTSGLPRYLFQSEFLEDLKANPLKSRKPIDGLLLLDGVEPLHAVGEKWAYSDTNYMVLGLIIEKITKTSFYDVATDRILDRFELTNTKPSNQPKMEGLVQGHIGSVNLFQLPKKTVSHGAYVINPDFEWCGGGFITNSSDWAKWLHALHSGKVLESEMHEQLVSAVDFRSGQPADQGYGLGTFVWKSDNGLFYGHAGIMPGYLTHMEYSKDHQFAIAFQTNTDEGMGQGLHQLVQEFAQILIDHSN